MSIDRENRKKIFLTACICMSILSISFDTGSYIPWDIIKMNIPKVSDVGNIVISLQVTLVSTSIAIVAILSGLTNKKIYSKSVTEFITKDQPILFKHRNIIIALLSLIFVNYVLWVKDFYNCEVVVFIISLFLVVLMSWEIFGVFYGEKNIKEQIKNFIINNYDDKYLENINNDLLNFIESGNTLKIKDSIEILEQLFIKILEDNDIKSLKTIQDVYCDCFTKMFKSYDRYKITLAIENITKLYEIAKDKQPILIWERCRIPFCRSLPLLQYDDLIINLNYNPETHITTGCSLFSQLHENLYNSINLSDDPIASAKCFEMKYFTRDIYLSIILNNKCDFSEKDSEQFCKFLYTDLENLTNNKYSIEIKNLILKELSLYTSTLIDNFEKNVLSDVFFYPYSNIKKPIKFQQYYCLTTLIYCFYLVSYRENIYYPDTKKRELLDFIIINNINIKTFLSGIDFTITNDEKNKIENIVFECRINSLIKKESAVSFVAIDFIIFVYLILENSEDNLINKLKHLIKKEESSFYYDKYFENENFYFITHFKYFYKLFLPNEELTHSAIFDNIPRLKNALKNL